MEEVEEVPVLLSRSEAISLTALLGFLNRSKAEGLGLYELERTLLENFDIGDEDLDEEYSKFEFVPIEVSVQVGERGEIHLSQDIVEIHYHGS